MMAEIARQRWSAARYAETAHFVPALGAPVLEMLEPSPGEHILDLLRHVLMDETGTWIADYVRLRFRATRDE